MQGLQRGLGREEKDFFFHGGDQFISSVLFEMVPFMFCYIKITSFTYFSMPPMLTRAIEALDADKSCKYMKQFESYDFKIKE